MSIFTLIAVVIAYLIGSLSSAVITCKLMHLPDPRTQGSKNPGATNVLRIGGKKAAIITLVGDALKGFLPVLVAHGLGMTGAPLACVLLAAFLGHLFPVFFNFQGGKGVATGIGGLLALNWLIAVFAIFTWVIVAAIFRYSSLAAIVAAILVPVYNVIWGNPEYQPVLLVLLVLILWRHRANIKRLLSGTEKKLGR